MAKNPRGKVPLLCRGGSSARTHFHFCILLIFPIATFRLNGASVVLRPCFSLALVEYYCTVVLHERPEGASAYSPGASPAPPRPRGRSGVAATGSVCGGGGVPDVALGLGKARGWHILYNRRMM